MIGNEIHVFNKLKLNMNKQKKDRSMLRDHKFSVSRKHPNHGDRYAGLKFDFSQLNDINYESLLSQTAFC